VATVFGNIAFYVREREREKERERQRESARVCNDRIVLFYYALYC